MPKTMNNTGTWLVLGVGVGVAIGTALNDTAVGTAVGAAVGLAVGSYVDRSDCQKRAEHVGTVQPD